jgi:hypothetical protein
MLHQDKTGWCLRWTYNYVDTGKSQMPYPITIGSNRMVHHARNSICCIAGMSLRTWQQPTVSTVGIGKFDDMLVEPSSHPRLKPWAAAFI